MNSSSYILNFTIPQGPTGPTDGLNVYAGKYNNTGGNISIGIGSQQVPLPSFMPSLRATYTPSNSITVLESGVYEIHYFANLSAALSTTLTMAIRANGTNIPSTVISRSISVGNTSIYSGSTIVSLANNSVIDMTVSALVSVGITLGSGTSASLTLKKIN